MINNDNIKLQLNEFANSVEFPKNDQKLQLMKVNEIITNNTDLKFGEYNFTVQYDPYSSSFKVELIIPMVFSI